jgi:phosphoribosylformylglycinamidine synthase
LGGSEYYKILAVDGGQVPRVDKKLLTKCLDGVLSSIDKGYIAACHDISEGGLAVCISEMAIGGDIGALVDISEAGKNLRTDFKLFSESNTRWVVEVKKEKQKDFEKILRSKQVPFVCIGEIQGKNLVIKDNKKIVVELGVKALRDCWKNSIWNIMG